MKAFRFLGGSFLFLFLLGGTSAALYADINRWSKIGPDGGDVLKMVMDPRSSQTIYAITNNAGLFKTTDGGAQWRSIDEDLPHYSIDPNYQLVYYYQINGLSIDPQDTSILYVGILQKGLYKSLDGGEHWTFQSFPGYIRDTAMSPVDHQIVFAATEKGILKSTDSGQTWIQVYFPAGDDKIIRILRFDPRIPTTLYAIGNRVAISRDGGQSWSESTAGSGGWVFDFAIDPNNSSTLYVLFDAGLYKSTDGGASWTLVRSIYAETITVDPSNSSILYLGYLSADYNNFFKNTMRSTDGGQSWSLFALDRYQLLFEPSNPKVVYSAAWKKGVYKSTGGGQTWAFSSQGIRKLESGSLAFAPSSSPQGLRTQSPLSALYIGCPVGIFKSLDGGGNWQGTNDDLSNKNISDLKVEDVSGNTLQAGIMNVTGGMGYSPGGVFKSADGGVHWTGLNEGLTTRDVRRLLRTNYPTSSVWKTGTSAQIPETLYVATGGGGVFKSIDGGANWSPKNSGFPYSGLYIADLAGDPENRDILYAANSSGVFKSENGAETWVSTGLTVASNCLSTDSRTPSVIYAGTSQGIYKSVDGGKTWKIRSIGLGNVNVTGIDLDPNDALKIVVGTSSAGVFWSLDGAESWAPLNRGLDAPAIKDIAFDPASPATIYVSTSGDGLYTMTIAPAPRIAVDKTGLNFGARPGGAVTPSQTIRVSNIGDAPLTWTAESSSSWIQRTPGAGIENGAINVSINPAGLSPGNYTGTILVQDPLAMNSPQTIGVNLKVYDTEPTAQAPFGFIDVPVDGTNDIAGAIPVCGWALDDIGVQSVRIYRDPVGLEQMEPGGLVFVGDAVFVEGARPDVELVYPGLPFSYRAGWGYMLLTNFLPNNGNGTFTLHALATDAEGWTTDLGTKTMSCDNEHAVKPFGTIDTPTQGGTASGDAFVHFGWALTPLPKSIPIDGSTISVWIDGLPLGHPVYNNYRPDIADLFPGYANSNGAVGYYYLDTTGYSNGVHTIAWSVGDSDGAADGIGSRYFQILNTGSLSSAGGTEAANSRKMGNLGGTAHLQSRGGVRSTEEIQSMIMDMTSPVYVRRGYSFGEPAEPVYPDRDGRVLVSLSQIERVAIYLDLSEAFETQKELQARRPNLLRREVSSFLPQAVSVSKCFNAYLLVGTELHPLPIGATFDSERGVLYWQPGPGFLGEYQFVLIDLEKSTKKTIKIMIVPARDSKK